MSQKTLRNILIFGTLSFALILIGMTVHSLAQVSSVRTAELTDQVVNGKRIWQQRNCDDCHTILGIGGYFAPELTKEAERRDSAFLSAFLKNPQSAKPGTTMPDQRLSDAQVQDLIAFFQWVSKIDTNDWPPQPLGAPAGTGVTAPGALLFQQKGCSGCHQVNGQGASGPGPDLSHIASQPYDQLSNTPEFLSQWLQNPAALKPTTTMPAVPLTDAERQALVDYLTSLK